MLAKDDYESIKEKFAKNEISEVFSILADHHKNISQNHEIQIILLNNQFEEFNKKERLGIVSEYKELNRIKYGLLEVIELAYRDQDIRKSKDNTIPILGVLIVVLFIAVISNIVERYIPETSKIEALTKSLKRINATIELNKSPLLRLTDSKRVFCERLQCTPEEGENFIGEYEKYLNSFLRQYEHSTKMNSKSIDKRREFCERYLDKESIIQVIDNNLSTKSYHKENFCDSLIIFDYNPNITFKEVDYQIESVFLNLKPNIPEDDYNQPENTIRIILKANCKVTKCSTNTNCLNLELKSTIICELIGSNARGYDYRIEGFLIDDSKRKYTNSTE